MSFNLLPYFLVALYCKIASNRYLTPISNPFLPFSLEVFQKFMTTKTALDKVMNDIHIVNFNNQVLWKGSVSVFVQCHIPNG